jgi:hypothetical protein
MPQGSDAAGAIDSISDAWSTTKRQFRSGSELLLPEASEDLAELHASFQTSDGNGDAANMLGTDMDSFREMLEVWPEDARFCAQDLTLYTHVNARTGDRLFCWNYGLGDNDHGSFHFLLAGEPRSSSTHVMTNRDGDLSFLGERCNTFADVQAWPKPEPGASSEAWARQVDGLIQFYQRVEKKLDCDVGGRPNRFTMSGTPVDVRRFPVDGS